MLYENSIKDISKCSPQCLIVRNGEAALLHRIVVHALSQEHPTQFRCSKELHARHTTCHNFLAQILC